MNFLTQFTIITESPLVADISFCPRCRKNHRLGLKPLALATNHFWALCPATKEPIVCEYESEVIPPTEPEFDWPSSFAGDINAG